MCVCVFVRGGFLKKTKGWDDADEDWSDTELVSADTFWERNIPRKKKIKSPTPEIALSNIRSLACLDDNFQSEKMSASYGVRYHHFLDLLSGDVDENTSRLLIDISHVILSFLEKKEGAQFFSVLSQAVASIPSSLEGKLDGIFAKSTEYQKWAPMKWTYMESDGNESVVVPYRSETKAGLYLNRGLASIAHVYVDLGSRHAVVMTKRSRDSEEMLEVCICVFFFLISANCVVCVCGCQGYDPTGLNPHLKILCPVPSIDPNARSKPRVIRDKKWEYCTMDYSKRKTSFGNPVCFFFLFNDVLVVFFICLCVVTRSRDRLSLECEANRRGQ